MLADHEYQFERFPRNSDRSLQAWDAADEYLYEHCRQQDISSLLIYNDSFGFLSLTLSAKNMLTTSDSACTRKAISNNARLNSLREPATCHLGEASGSFDHIIIKMVKSLDLLAYEVAQASRLLSPEGVIILSGMSKHIHTSTIKLFEKYFHTVNTSLAKKKARLLFASGPKEDKRVLSGMPPAQSMTYKGLEICSHPGVFSSGKIDGGTKLLLETLPEPESSDTIIDLGCGNGIIGITLAKYHTMKKVIFSDDSFLAIQSTKENWVRNIESSIQAEFLVQHSLQDIPEDSVDMVVSNPPYHQGFTNTQQIAISFFNDAQRVLKKGGSFWVVANNHLGYIQELDRLFSHASMVTKNSAYTIYRAVK